MEHKFDKIVSNPEILGGKPCIAGTRISVEIILEWIASGANIDAIITKFPYLEKDAVKQAIIYASKFTENEIVIEVEYAA